MNNSIEFPELYEQPIAEFRKHLEKPGNDRILFSGMYGIGKTSFLKKFFSQKKESDSSLDYEVYHLYPVNYSIASNEDIVRYIKHDIIWQFLLKGEEFPAETNSYLETLPNFVKKNLTQVLAAFIYMVPKIGKDVVDVFEKWKKLKEKFLSFHQEANRSESDKLEDYLSSLENRGGSLYENDIITKIIASVVQKDSPQRSVLIIDDLDRIDPEHVFRIMNVFAAHLDKADVSLTKNKFGFDIVILVCDYKNIKNLFHYRYGHEVDFKGYVDKFYSSDVFHFDNRGAIKSILKRCCESFAEYNKADNNIADFMGFFFDDDFFYTLLFHFIEQRELNLRSVLKIINLKIDWTEKLKFRSHVQYSVTKFSVAYILKIFCSLFGDVDNFKESIKRSTSHPKLVEDFQKVYALLLMVTNINNFVNGGTMEVDHNGKSLIIQYKNAGGFINDIYVYHAIDEDFGQIREGEEYCFYGEDISAVILSAVNRLEEIGFIA